MYALSDHLPPITGEHLLGPSSNIQDRAELDIAANGLLGGEGGGGFERTYFDVRVLTYMLHQINIPTLSHVTTSLK